MSKVASIHGSRNVRSVFISDVHLGFPGCSAACPCYFLERLHGRKPYLAGHIVDFRYLRKRRSWPESHSCMVCLPPHNAQHDTRMISIPANTTAGSDPPGSFSSSSEMRRTAIPN
jgi:hypothetical protein